MSDDLKNWIWPVAWLPMVAVVAATLALAAGCGHRWEVCECGHGPGCAFRPSPRAKGGSMAAPPGFREAVPVAHPYVGPSRDALPRVTPSAVATRVTETSTDRKGKTTVCTYTTTAGGEGSSLVWVEGYFVDTREKGGNYVRSTYVPGHWETRK